MKRKELIRQRERDAAEDRRKDSAVPKGKLFGDALRASSIRMGNDPIEAVAFFKNCEQLFDAYGVPHSLKAILSRPFHDERARSYLAKLDTAVSGDYDTLKQALLRDFKLSPNVYLERFNKCVKTSDDTYIAFASKLTSLLDYYLKSRKVTIFHVMCELLVCDRIKSTLSDDCLKYVLSVESATEVGWLGKTQVTDAIDRYATSHGKFIKPKTYAVGQTVPQMLKPNQENLGFKPKPSGNGAGRGNGKTYGANAEAKVGAVRHISSISIFSVWQH